MEGMPAITGANISVTQDNAEDLEQCKTAKSVLAYDRALAEERDEYGNTVISTLFVRNQQSKCFQGIVRDLGNKKWTVELPRRIIGEVATNARTNTVSFRPPRLY